MLSSDPIAGVTIDVARRRLVLPDGTRAPFTWLRDRCPCGECRHASGQRLYDPATMPPDINILDAVLDASDHLTVTWSENNHRSTYRLESLRAAPAPARTAPTLWDAATVVAPVAQYDDITRHPAAMAEWLAGIDRLGFGMLRRVPVADGEVARVAELFGHVRVTNYGRFFDVRSIAEPSNLANTSLGLAAHTDNPYRDPVPSLQLLHCLQSSISGGENLLVDGFQVAAEVRAALPAGFALLSSRPVSFAYLDDTTELRASAPLVALLPDGSVRAVRCNSRSMQPPALPHDDLQADDLTAWYDAYLLFTRLLTEPRLQYRLRLDPGDLFIVDNRRVLHGRTAFAASTAASVGTRHLQGCYADIDGLRSTHAVLGRARDGER